MSKIKLLLVLCAICFLGGQAKAQVVLSSCNQTYTQNFNLLGVNSTPMVYPDEIDNTYLPGWYIAPSSGAFQGSDNGTNSTLANQGGRNYHSINSTDYSLGSYAESGVNYIGLYLENQTGSPITSFTITYTGEQWRRGNNGTTSNTLRFAYRMSNASITVFDPGYTLVSALDFKAPQNVPGGVCNNNGTALDGNLAANRKMMSATITLATPLADGDKIMLRWQDLNHSCGDHGVSVDDVSVSFSTIPQVAGTLSGAPVICGGTNYVYQINGTVGTPSAVDQDGNTRTTTIINNNQIRVEVPSTGVTKLTVTNTLAASACNIETSKSLTVNVLEAPVAGTAPTLTNQSCNTVTLSLSTLDFSDKIVRWEYSTDLVLWQAINSANTTINYTITADTWFRAIITRKNSTCYEVATPEVGTTYDINVPVLSTPVVLGDCSTSTITIDETTGAFGTFTISPNPRNVSPIPEPTAVYTNLPNGTYVITFMASNGCKVTRSVSVNGSMLMTPNLYPEPYAVSRTSITPEWQKYTGASSYQLQYKKTFGGPTTTISNITTLRRAVTNLLCNTSYDFRIRARCSSGKYSPYTSWMTDSTQGCIAREASWSNDGEFSLYPNPNNGNFNISFDAENGNTGTVSVVDLNGKAVTTHDFTAIDGANSINMNLNGVAQGIYLVRFQMGDVIKTQKIVVE